MNSLRCPGLLPVLLGILLLGLASGATAAEPGRHKVMIYPGPGESIDQLAGQGIENARNYGAYWLAEVSDDQANQLIGRYGQRAVKANYLNVIELAACPLDTTAAEPSIPANLKASPPAKGHRLCLVQFEGPVLPEWLELVQAAGQATILRYIPNNAYLLWLSAGGEAALRKLAGEDGPIQWVGSYHGYYKLAEGLRRASDATVNVRVALVDHELAEQAAAALQRRAVNVIGEPESYLNQVVVQLEIAAAELPGIAQLPWVIWIEPVVGYQHRDEVQDLVVSSRISGPGNGPLPATDNYLDFLVNTLGFSTTAEEYPVVDVADSGLDNGSIFPYHPDFYDVNLGVRDFITAWNGEFTPFCGGQLPQTRVAYNWSPDADGHGTVVASIISGLNDNPNTESGAYLSLGSRVELLERRVNPETGELEAFCALAECGVSPVPYLIERTDENGFQLGMGVSPFGTFGASLGGADDPNFNTFLHGANVYISNARISNNSWGEIPFIDPQDGTAVNIGKYGVLSQQYDILVRDVLRTGSTEPPTPGPSPLNQEMIYVFAAGNAGGTGEVGGIGDVLVTPPATAKNIITVGASENARPDNGCLSFSSQSDDSLDISYFSSFGTTEDGRIKPDIVAPGASVYGALTQFPPPEDVRGCDPDDPLLADTPPAIDCLLETDVCAPVNAVQPIFELYTCTSGTSFSAPAVSGAVQLLWWWFQNRLLNERGEMILQPSPAMAKAYIINAARYLPIINPITEVQDTIPSIAQGYGILDLDRMFDGIPRMIRDQSPRRAIDTPLINTNTVNQQTYFTRVGQSYEVSGQVFDPREPFRVSLVWTDVPGDPAAFKQLVNDLDLQVTVGGQTYRGNVFQGEHSVTGGAPDDLNNMEAVHLPAGTEGSFEVVVNAMTIAGDGVPNIGATLDQDFALVVYNAAPVPLPSDVPNLALNDACATATLVNQDALPFTDLVDTTTYSNVLPSPTAGRGGSEAFYRLNVPTNGTIILAGVTENTQVDTRISIWRGNCGELREVISESAVAGNLTTILAVADGENDYYLVVEGVDKSQSVIEVTLDIVSPVLTITPPELDFGEQIVGTESNPLVFVVTNTGDTSLNVESAVLGGIDPDVFSIIIDGCSGNPLLPGSSCGISITYRPTAVLQSIAELIIQSDSPVPLVGRLRGQGIIAVPEIAVQPGTLVFSDVVIGTASDAQTVTVSNEGTASAVITGVNLAGEAADLFEVLNDGCAGQTLAPEGSCTIDLVFEPDAVGVFSARLDISHTAPGSPATVSLVGTAVVPPSDLVADPAAVTFPTNFVGVTSSPLQITIENANGAGAVIVSAVQLAGSHLGDFGIDSDGCNGATLQPGATCELSITFTPTVAGERAAEVLVFHDGAGANPVVVPLDGTAVEPAPLICAEPSTVYFRNNTLDETGPPSRVTVRNCGIIPLTLDAPSITGSNASHFAVADASSCLAGTILPDETCSIDVTFTPSGSDVVRTAILNITSPDALNSPQQVALSSARSQPDAKITRSPFLPFIGNDIYNTDGTDQTIAVDILANGANNFYVAIQNDGNEAEQYRLCGTGSSDAFDVRYFVGSDEITTAVLGGSYLTSLLNPGGALTGDNLVRVEITPETSQGGIQEGAVHEVLLTAGPSGAAAGTPGEQPTGGCYDNELTLSITLDDFPQETTWDIRDESGAIVASGGPYAGQSGTIVENISLDATGGVTDYTFTIRDSFGDGICCSWGIGSYSLVSRGETIASGGAFGSAESTNFCVNPSIATCFDETQVTDAVKIVSTIPCSNVVEVVRVPFLPFTRDNVNMRDRTDDTPSPECGTGGRDLAFRLDPNVAVPGAVITVTTEDSNYDTLLSVWTGGVCGPVTEVACSGTVLGVGAEEISFTPDGEAIYYIVAEGIGGAWGSLDLHITSTIPIDSRNLGEKLGAVAVGDGWYWLEWLGYFYASSDSRWIFHLQHGWLYAFGDTADGITFWDAGMGAFWWTSELVYPNVYRFSTSHWLWYQRGSVSPRWFHNYGPAVWEQW